MTVSSTGDFVVTGGNDRSIRIWSQTDEPVFLDSERQKERDEAADAKVALQQQKIGVITGSGIDPTDSESAAINRGKASSEMLRDSERLIDLLDTAIVDDTNWTRYYELLAKQKAAKHAVATAALENTVLVGSVQRTVPLSADRAATAAAAAAAARTAAGLSATSASAASAAVADEPVPTPPKNPMLWGKTASESLLQKLSDIKSTDLEETLLVLPFEYAMRLLSHLDGFLAPSNGKGAESAELCIRCVLFLLTIHHTQIIANQMFVGTLCVWCLACGVVVCYRRSCLYVY